MTLRKIVTLPDPVLRRKAREIKKFDKDLHTLIDDMVETMREAPGVGLAAPQIGFSERLLVVEYYEREPEEVEEGNEGNIEEPPKKVWAIINPEITKASEEKVMGVEGCLSIPGLVGEVERHEEVLVKGLNKHGKPMKVKAGGWLARIFQHEIDHLNGVLFPDLATQVWQPQQEVEEEQEF